MLSATCFNWDQSKILSSGNGLIPLPALKESSILYTDGHTDANELYSIGGLPVLSLSLGMVLS